MSNSSDYWHVQTGSKGNTSEIFIKVTKDGQYILHGQVPFHLQYIIPDPLGPRPSDPLLLWAIGQQTIFEMVNMLPWNFSMGSIGTLKNCILTFTVSKMLSLWPIFIPRRYKLSVFI
ncbi:hypothetical protein [Sphingobacterium puteale]|uniref:hypothetical protein n=1 Tax=Sphingobacterium puteale TaxID=2420510 RepID=UPI003D98CAB7